MQDEEAAHANQYANPALDRPPSMTPRRPAARTVGRRPDRLRAMILIAAGAFIGFFSPAAQASDHPPRPTAFFNFTLRDTSLQGEMQGVRTDEAKRLASTDAALQQMLLQSGCCTPVDLSKVADRAAAQSLQSCNGCDVDLAREAGADIAVTGWVQKVSNLILNMNITIRDVATGHVIGEGSVDMRGNTDKSWSRAISYLVRNQLHPADW